MRGGPNTGTKTSGGKVNNLFHDNSEVQLHQALDENLENLRTTRNNQANGEKSNNTTDGNNPNQSSSLMMRNQPNTHSVVHHGNNQPIETFGPGQDIEDVG